MASDAARVVFGIAAAVLIGWGLPVVRCRWWSRAAAAALLAAWALWPFYDRHLVHSVAAVVLSATAAATLPDGAVKPPKLGAFRRRGAALALPLVFSCLAAVIAVGWHATVESVDGFVGGRNNILVYVDGLGIATFAVGAAIAVLLRPLQDELVKRGEPLASLKNAGTYVGWLERSLFFTLFVTGHASAAAIALTAKSIARFPTLPEHREGFAEYFLIGTMLSLVLAAAVAAVARLVLGLSVLG